MRHNPAATSLKGAVLRGTKWTSISFIIIFACQFFQFVLLARFLAPSELGQLAVFTIINGLADLILGMGLTQAIIQRNRISSRELSTLYWLNIGMALIVATVLWFSSKPIGDFLNSPGSATLIQLSAPLFILTALGQTHRAVLEKRMRFGRIAITESAAAILTIGTTGAFLMMGHGVLSGVFGLLIGAALRSCLFRLISRRYFRVRFHLRIQESRRFFSFGVLQALDGIVTYATITASTIATGRFGGEASMGGYNLAFNTAVNLPARLNSVLTRVLFPAFSKIQNDLKRLSDNYLRVLAAVGIINLPLLTLLALVSEDFIKVVYGSQWADTSDLMSILATVGILRSLVNPVGMLLQATDNMKTSLIMNVIKLSFTVPLVSVGAVLFGAKGAAYGLLLSYVLSFAITYVVVRSVLRIPLLRYCVASFTMLPAVILMAGCVWVTDIILAPLSLPPLILLASKTVVALLVVVPGLLISRNPLLVDVRAMLLSRVGRSA